jgi:hypothetical protein
MVMEISKAAMLDKTHYGLRIYAHVLRLYYPDQVVLALKGRDCQPANNPFNKGKATLLVRIVDGIAVHTDDHHAIPDGNAFDFAAMHYQFEGQALLDKLNEDMHLKMGEKKMYYHLPENRVVVSSRPKNLEKQQAPVFSYFRAPVTNIIPSAQVSLMEVYHKIRGNAFSACTNTLRGINDAKEARRYKAIQFDYVTFSGTFSKRNDANLLCHSGLMAVDFDHLPDIDTVKQVLLQDAYFDTEMLFVSPSGDGLKWIIAIDISQVTHGDYFRAVANYIQHTYGLAIDASGKDISRACFLPMDPQVFIHPKYL